MDFLRGVAAILITIVGMVLVAFMVAVVYVGLLPLNYLWVLARTLRSAPAANLPMRAATTRKLPMTRQGSPAGAAGPWARQPGSDRPRRPGPAVRWEPTVARRTSSPRTSPPKWPTATAPPAKVRDDTWGRPHPDQSISIPSYFFGQAVEDLRFVIRTGIKSCQASIASGAYLATGALDSDLSIFGVMAGVGVYAGLAVGGVLGGLIAAGVGLVNLLVVAVAMLVAWCACG